MLTLRDIMTRDIVSVAPDLPLSELMELLTDRNISGAPVVSGREVVGVISATDLLSFGIAAAGVLADAEEDEEGDRGGEETGFSSLEEEELPAGYFTAVWNDTANVVGRRGEETSLGGSSALYKYTVSDAMSREVQSLPPETDVVAAAEFMKRAGVHRVLVMKNGQLQGIVSTMDIVNAVAKHRIPTPQFTLGHEQDFDPGWSHEPIVPEE